MSRRRVVSGGDVRVVVQEGVYSGPSSFAQFDRQNATFVDKSLAIEAFLRDRGGHHLVLRPRQPFREFLQRPLKRGPSTGDITTSHFAGTAITDHSELVSKHFRQYPVLYIDLKDVHGTTFEEMLILFDAMVLEIIGSLCNPYSDLVDENFCKELRGPGALEPRRGNALKILTRELLRVYQKEVVVLIDEYDSPMHSAIEHGYAALANNFFSAVFGSLLKSNDAVFASMMVGICRIAKSGWLSSLNHVKIFPMHAEDDRYAKLFLFTEKEVEILCDNHSQLSVELLQPRYNGYAATHDSGLVKLYNPFSVVRALEANKISNFWVETGRYSPLSQNLWRAGQGFRDNLDLLLTQKSVRLVVDEHVNFLSYDAISDSGLWGLLYYTGYLTIESVLDRSMSQYIFRIPNGEVTAEWHEWVMKYLVANRVTSLSSVYDTIVGGDAVGFQKQFTAFLQEYLALFCAPHHKEKVYQAMCYMLIYALFGKEYDVRMEQDAGHGRSDITAHPFSAQRFLALIFEIKSVARHLKRNGKRSLKTAEQMRKDLEKAKIEALGQLADRRYRERVPRHATKVHEFAFVFCGKFCVAAVRTLQRNSTENWEEVAADSTVVSESMTDMGDEDVGDEDEEA
ncbi:putative AAA-ATPase domain containing protein [Amanita muscaria]